jgi:hypothetical protein
MIANKRKLKLQKDYWEDYMERGMLYKHHLDIEREYGFDPNCDYDIDDDGNSYCVL